MTNDTIGVILFLIGLLFSILLGNKSLFWLFLTIPTSMVGCFYMTNYKF